MQKSIYSLKEIIVYLHNTPGSLHKLAKALATKGINIDSITGFANSENLAQVRIITKDPSTTTKSLEHLDNIKEIKTQEVIVVSIENKPGELSKITQKLTLAGINLEGIYLLSKTENITHVAIEPQQDKFQATLKLLGE